jgi:hypothetical protein
MFLDQSGLFFFGNRVLQLRSGGRIGRQLKEGIPLDFFAYECAIWAVHPRLPIRVCSAILFTTQQALSPTSCKLFSIL